MRKTKLKTFCLTILLFCSFCSPSVGQKRIFKGTFKEKNEKIEIRLDLYKASLYVPGMTFIGKVHGYMTGDIYGIWMLTSFKTKGKKATLRFSNDLGSDSQSIKLTAVNDSIFEYEAIDGNHIRKVHNRKLVKIPTKLCFTRQ